MFGLIGKRKKIHIKTSIKAGPAAAGILAAFVLTAVYAFLLCARYQPVKIGQQEFYGTKNQNLKDFVRESDRLRSVSGDSWVECELPDVTNIRVIEIKLRNVEKPGMRGEVFDKETWDSKSFNVKNGRILLFYGWTAGQGKKNLRFDFVEEAGACLDIESVVINSGFGLACDVAQRFLFLLACSLFFSFFIKAGRQKKALTFLWLGMQAAAAAAAFCIVTFTDRTVSEIIWVWILCFAQMGLGLVVRYEQSKGRKKAREYLSAFLQKACFVIVCVALFEVSSGTAYNFQNILDGLWNFVLVWLAVTMLGILLRSEWIPMIIVSTAVVMLGTANHYFYLFRKDPLQMTDILLAETAAAVAGNYTYSVNSLLAFFFLSAGNLFFDCMMLKESGWNSREQKSRIWQARIAGVFLAILGTAAYTPQVSYWNMVQSTQTYGYLNAFVGYAKKDLQSQKPPGYSLQNVKEILDLHQQGQAENKQTENKQTENDGINKNQTDVIVIMNEAFSDLPAVYEFETDTDGMPFLHTLEKHTRKGNLLVSVFGGSTANTEYEFLTGNSIAFFRAGSVPYVQYVKGQQQSLTSVLKGLGYQTIAFHPSAAANYNRDSVYPLLGFDAFYASQSELKYRENLRGYMSDDADFKNVIDFYESRDAEKPFFMFNVTMQNHGGYSYEKSSVAETVKPVRKDLQCAQLIEYLSLVKKTDEAFERLVNYFSKVDRKVVILMFGDHQPGLSGTVYDRMQHGTQPAVWQRYVVPYVLWGNFEFSCEDNAQMVSPGYLRQMFMEAAGIPLDAYGQFLARCREQYPAMNCFGYFTADGIWHASGELPADGLLGQYRMLQYANTFDKKAKALFGK